VSVSTTDVIKLLREDVLRDFSVPGLFSDSYALLALNEAHREFARYTHCYIDDVVLDLNTGVSVYQMPQLVEFVYGVTAHGRSIPPYMRFQQPQYPTEGRVRAYTTDLGKRRIKFYPAPDEDIEVVVEAAMIPQQLTLDPDTEIELDPEWINVLLDWCAYRALRNNDADASETIAADQFMLSWSVGIQNAKRAFMRQRHGMNNVVPYTQWVI